MQVNFIGVKQNSNIGNGIQPEKEQTVKLEAGNGMITQMNSRPTWSKSPKFKKLKKD